MQADQERRRLPGANGARFRRREPRREGGQRADADEEERSRHGRRSHLERRETGSRHDTTRHVGRRTRRRRRHGKAQKRLEGSRGRPNPAGTHRGQEEEDKKKKKKQKGKFKKRKRGGCCRKPTRWGGALVSGLSSSARNGT